MKTHAPAAPAALAALALLCAPGCAPSPDELAAAAQPVIVGANDYRLVGPLGPGGIPTRYEPLYPSIGQLLRHYASASASGVSSKTCTVSYIGRGVALTAGHCLDAPSSEVRDVTCPGVVVNWASIAGAPATLTSACQRVLRARDDTAGTDYALFEVFPPPTRALAVDTAMGASSPGGGRATLFSHPKGAPLTWSGTCALTTPYGSIFPHQCDLEGGSSGAPILDDDNLAVVGIVLGDDAGILNYGRYLSATPTADVYNGRAAQAAGITVVSASTTFNCSGASVSRDDGLALMQAHNGYRARAVTPPPMPGCAFASTSVRYQCGGIGSTYAVGTNNAASPFVTLSCPTGAAEEPPFWTLFASEENGGPATSCQGPLGHIDLPRPRAVDGVACRGSYCDAVSVRCPSSERAPITGAPFWTASFSEESPQRNCPAGYYVTGLKCTGSYCDNLSLQCAASSRPWGACTLLPAFSEEQTGYRTCPAGTSLAGVRCTGRYCDNLSLYCC